MFCKVNSKQFFIANIGSMASANTGNAKETLTEEKKEDEKLCKMNSLT